MQHQISLGAEIGIAPLEEFQGTTAKSDWGVGGGSGGGEGWGKKKGVVWREAGARVHSWVSLVVSSVPDAWKPDFTPESEEAVHRISELKSYLNKQKGVTCHR